MPQLQNCKHGKRQKWRWTLPHHLLKYTKCCWLKVIYMSEHWRKLNETETADNVHSVFEPCKERDVIFLVIIIATTNWSFSGRYNNTIIVFILFKTHLFLHILASLGLLYRQCYTLFQVASVNFHSSVKSQPTCPWILYGSHWCLINKIISMLRMCVYFTNFSFWILMINRTAQWIR